jgi:hypothetical protein
MLLATLFPNYCESEFDLDTAMDSPKQMVITVEDAKLWAEGEINEGRDKQEWRVNTTGNITVWETNCNEYGESEEWILVVEDVPFWKP